MSDYDQISKRKQVTCYQHVPDAESTKKQGSKALGNGGNVKKLTTCHYVTKAEASRMLKVSPGVMSRLIESNGIPVFQIPGHNRQWLDRAAVESLLAKSTRVGGGA